MKNYLLAGLLFLFGTALQAQNINGIVRNENEKPLTGATVALLNAKDSSTVKYSVTDKDGLFKFNNVPGGDYLLKLSFVGYNNAYIKPFAHSATTDLNVGTMDLVKADAQSLSTVTVTAKRPIVEVKADKTVLNVEGTANSLGTDGLELLRKSPGVMVDKDDNISVSGKTGVKVYIDGRPSPLTGTELSAYLKTLQSNGIEAIEIVSNPSAKYEAAGNAGIINIRLIKNKSYGTNGTATAGYGIGIYPKYNGSLSLNNRNKVANIFGNVSYTKNKSQNVFNLERFIGDTAFMQRNVMTNRMNSLNYKLGADFSLNAKNTVGVLVNGSNFDMDMFTDGRTGIIQQSSKQLNRTLVANNTNSMGRDNINVNANYQYLDNKAGKTFNMDADYGKFKNSGDQFQPNVYLTPSGSIMYSIAYQMLSPTDIDLASVKADWEQNAWKGKIGVGGKVSNVKSDNVFQRYTVNGGSSIYDSLRSNKFDYKENINALYATYSRNLKGKSIQVGLRVENTSSKGESTGWADRNAHLTPYDSSFKRDYTDLFPSASITFNKNPMKQWSLSYSRRIDRPAYQDLNPFEFKLDEYTFMKGNINLRPQYTNNFGATFSYKYKLNVAAKYSHVKDLFSMLMDTVDRTKSFNTKANLATQDVYSLNVSYPFTYKKFMAFVNLNTYYSDYQANFGPGRDIDLHVFAGNIFSQMTYKFTPKLTGELSGFYNTPSIFQGTFKSKAMGGMDLGLTATVLKGKGTLKGSVSDVFKTMQWGGTSNFAGQYSHAFGNWESRQFKLNFAYRFGSAEVKAARQRKSAAEEERGRTQSSGGLGQ